MFVRSVTFVALLAFALLPAVASAQGVRQHGHLVSAPHTYSGTVGSCVCDDSQWYTVGFHKGTAVISGKLTTVDGDPEFSYGINVFLLRGDQTVGQAQAACAGSQRPCNKTFRIKARVTHPGVYFVKVFGLGSEGIHYTVRLAGPIVRLTCRRGYC